LSTHTRDKSGRAKQNQRHTLGGESIPNAPLYKCGSRTILKPNLKMKLYTKISLE